MRLTDWATAPQSAPPPIPLATDAVSASNFAYRVGAIPPDALRADLAAAGLTYSLGRGNGYRRHGQPLDAYLVGEVIADTLDDAASLLSTYLADNPTMRSVGAAREALARMPYRDGQLAHNAERERLAQRLSTATRGLAVSYDELELVARSLFATARMIRGYPSVRSEAVRRFRSVISAPALPTISALSVGEFLASVPPGPIARPDLHAAALASGVAVGSRTLYVAADALGWPSANRRGVRRYRVPALP